MKVLLFLILAVSCLAVPITITWDANPEPGITGYRVHYGNFSRMYHTVVPVGNVTTAQIDLPRGREYYLAVTALIGEHESDRSNEISYNLDFDTDGDGIPNLWEAANGLNPLSPIDGPANLFAYATNRREGATYFQVEVFEGKSYFVFYYTKRKLQIELSYFPQKTYDLRIWDGVAENFVELGKTSLDEITEIVRVRVLPEIGLENVKGFWVRLKVSSNFQTK